MKTYEKIKEVREAKAERIVNVKRQKENFTVVKESIVFRNTQYAVVQHTYGEEVLQNGTSLILPKYYDSIRLEVGEKFLFIICVDCVNVGKRRVKREHTVFIVNKYSEVLKVYEGVHDFCEVKDDDTILFGYYYADKDTKIIKCKVATLKVDLSQLPG